MPGAIEHLQLGYSIDSFIRTNLGVHPFDDAAGKEALYLLLESPAYDDLTDKHLNKEKAARRAHKEQLAVRRGRLYLGGDTDESDSDSSKDEDEDDLPSYECDTYDLDNVYNDDDRC